MALIPLVPQPGQLLNLPDNVLHLILQNVAQTSPIQLYVLAILAKRLNSLALPLFLTRLGVSEPRQLVKLTLQPTSRRTPSSRLDALSGLRIALYVTSVDEIHCTLDFRESAHDAFFQALRRLGGFLSRLTIVSEIHLDICGGIQAFELLKDSNVRLRWDAAFQQLSDAVTRKPGSRLVVTNAGFVTRSWVSSHAGCTSGSRRPASSRFDFPIRRLLGGEKQVFEAADARLAPPTSPVVTREVHSFSQRRPRSLSQPCAPRVSLTSVIVDSQTLLSHNLDWTLALLRSNTLSSLTMSDVQLPGLIWSSVLPQIAAAAPFLTQLDLSDSNVFPKDLLSFLSKLPLLESLKIDRSLRLFSPASHPYPKLSHLASLSAPPEYIAILLSVRGGLPHLRDLEVVLQNLSYVAAPHTAEAFQTIFNRLKEASPSVSPSPSMSPLPSVVSFTQHMHSTQQLILTLNVYVGSSSVQANLMKSIDSALSLGADWQRRMRSFTRVVLDGFPLVEAARDSSVWAALPRWLGIMPEVEVIEICAVDRRESGQGKPLEPMIRAISNRCSKVRKVVINEVEHEVLGVTHLQPPAISRSRAPSPLPYAVSPLLTTPILAPSPSPIMNRSPTPLRQGKVAPGLPNLPEDIMDRIVSYLTTDLYPLSLVCRRLNILAVSRMLSQHDIPNPAVKSHVVFRENPTAPDALTALQVAIHIPSIDHLSIKFPRTMCLFQFFDQLYRIRRLVARLTMLSKFTIDFGLGSSDHLKTANDALLARWTGLMEGLLNTVLEKSCHTLTVTGGAHFLGAYQLKKKRESFLFKDSGNPMKGNTWVFTRVPEQGSETIVAELAGRALTGQQPPPPPNTPNSGPGSSTNLRVLTIDSELLLRPPFLTWTVAAMRVSPLARLELCELPNDLSVILPVIAEAIPRLTELQISGDLNPEDVLEFIDKLPLLRSLSLGRTLYLDKADMESESIAVPKLRKLTHLTAPIEFVPFLLSQFLPQSSHYGNGNVTPPGGFIPPLKSLTIALPNPSLTNPSHITLANNILSISRLLHALQLSPAISLDISVPPTTAWAARDISIVSCIEPRWENAMKVISNITLRNYDAMHYGIGDPTQPPNRVVPKWLALFPGLQTAVIMEKMQSEPNTFLPLVHSIMRTCPDLSSVQINAKTYRPDHFRF